MPRSADSTCLSWHPPRCQVHKHVLRECVEAIYSVTHFGTDVCIGLGVKFVSDQRKLSSLIDGKCTRLLAVCVHSW